MSTDSSELAFVRCPSCRSLVPAVSTRCRMCGATLDPSNKAEDTSGEAVKSGRIRQRTTATPSSDLTAAAGLIRREMGDGTPDKAGSSNPTSVDLQAVSSTEAVKDESEDSEPIQQAHHEDTTSATESGPSDPDDDPLGAYIQEIDEEAHSSGASIQNGSSHKAQEAEPRAAGSSASASESAGRESSDQDRAKPKVVVESGARRNKPSGLSFGAGRGQQEREARPADQSGRQQQREDQRKGDRRPDRSDRGTEARHDQSGRGASDNRRTEDSAIRQNDSRGQDMRGGASSSGAANQQQKGRDNRRPDQLEMSQIQTGKLVGWLVSYSDPRGAAQELREGRFFVTASSLKDNDLVLDNPSVSTPHALIAAGVSDGVRVQDLMSDRGVWVKRKSQESFQRVNDSVKVDHGDWIRFGEVEFFICLVAGAVPR